jgi:Leucine-rich repeat (LRR) protein
MSFNIQHYLKSLPLDTEYININSLDLVVLPDLSRFKNLKYLNCSRNNLSILPSLNESLIHLDCNFNELSWLPPLNANLKILNCSHNELKEIPPLNDNLMSLMCSSNLLTWLPPLKNITVLHCDKNQLTCLPPINNKLKEINCSFNLLTWLPPIGNNLEILNCDTNKLNYLPLLNNLQIIICRFNNLDYIPCINVKNYSGMAYSSFKMFMNLIKTQTNILYKFRFTYYCNRFKTQFKKWLWEKVREPIIMQKFHPDHLNTLEDTDDLEEFLEEWVK